MNMINLAEKGLIPDSLIRYGIRRLCKQRLNDEYAQQPEKQQQHFQSFIDELKKCPIAVETDAANEQHYEIPTKFYELSLGKNLKYSGCNWPDHIKSLDEAEDYTLALYCERAELKDGMDILELGCGWGSLTLWMAKNFPNSLITGVSNSHGQKTHILEKAESLGLKNISIVTCDVNELALEKKFDRAVSIEMFEHMRNYQSLLKNVSDWLEPKGMLFVQVFCHRFLMYPFETQGDDNWMGKYFFTGGLMPSTDTLLHFQDHLKIEKRWLVDGKGYEKTANAWLDKLDKNYEQILEIFKATYETEDAKISLQRWRIFYMACAELFGYKSGSEWFVSHYLFENGKS